jgi:hypothetical protein
VLPSLWEATAGTREVTWGERRDGDTFQFTPAMARVWQWKDELPVKGVALVGRHFGPWAALVAPRLVPAVVAAAADRRRALTDFHWHVAATIEEHGACTGPQLRALCGAEKKHVAQLQRALVVTNSHLVEQPQGWDAIAVDLVERLWEVEPVDAADALLARVVLEQADELSAADLGGALGWRVRRAREALEAIGAHARTERGLTLYSLT